MTQTGLPPKQGLYDPANEHDSCGFGFVADIKGRPSHDIVAKALEVLLNLEHRGATGAEKDTGDGAGILLQTPHSFFARHGFSGKPGQYGAGMVFLPPGGEIEKLFEQIVTQEGQKLLGWRDVPTDNTRLGATARSAQPLIRQVFIESRCEDPAAFERKLYVIRRLIEKGVSRSSIKGRGHFYVPSLSHKTIVYKGMLNAGQLRDFYLDLRDPAMSSAIAMVTRASRPTPSRRGRARTPTATSRTTARSTRCAATSTGCTRASR
jgi:glutamate synthase (NADPH/NADH) large chain